MLGVTAVGGTLSGGFAGLPLLHGKAVSQDRHRGWSEELRRKYCNSLHGQRYDFSDKICEIDEKNKCVC